MEEQLENAFRFYRFSGEQEELREEMAGMGEISRRAVLDQYETMLKAQLLDLAAQEEVVLTDIELLLETDEKSGATAVCCTFWPGYRKGRKGRRQRSSGGLPSSGICRRKTSIYTAAREAEIMDTKKQSSFIEIVKSRFAGKGPRKDYLVIALLFGVLLLVIAMPVQDKTTGKTDSYPSDGTGNARESQAAAVEEPAYERQLEIRLENFLRQVDGVGQVQVLIRLKDAGEQVVEKDVPTRSTSQTNAQEGTQETESTTEEATVFEETKDGRQIPYVVREYAPGISGVVVAATGADDPRVEQDILEAVQALLQIEVHKIKVLKLKEGEGLY